MLHCVRNVSSLDLKSGREDEDDRRGRVRIGNSDTTEFFGDQPLHGKTYDVFNNNGSFEVSKFISFD
jgi:hypothetical protein